MRIFTAIQPEKKNLEIFKYGLTLLNNIHQIKIVPSENIHLTIKFWGEIENKKIEKLKLELMDDINLVNKFTISPKELIFFPNIDQAKIVAVSIEKNYEELMKLRKKNDIVSQSYGVAKDKRKYRPHYTLGRIKKECNVSILEKIKSDFDDYSKNKFIKNRVESYSIVRSILKKSGPVYETINQIKLKKQ